MYPARFPFLPGRPLTNRSMPPQDIQRARDIYRACLKLVPHKKFTFAKVWVQFAEFEIRQQELDAARKVMGMAIGMCPKEKVRSGASSSCGRCGSRRFRREC